MATFSLVGRTTLATIISNLKIFLRIYYTYNLRIPREWIEDAGVAKPQKSSM